MEIWYLQNHRRVQNLCLGGLCATDEITFWRASSYFSVFLLILFEHTLRFLDELLSL